MKKYIRLCLAATVLSVSISSCLKDDEHFVDFSAVGTIIEFAQRGFYAVQYPIVTDDQTLNVDLNIASPQVLSKEVVVTVNLDTTEMRKYNEAQAAADPNFKPYELMTAGAFSIPNNKVTIPAGKRLSPLVVKINTSKMDASKKLMIPLKITDAGGERISGNFNVALIAVVLKNKYAGSYHATGIFNHPTAGKRDIDEDKELSTIDGSTSETNFADLGGNGWKMWLKVNADNTVTIIPKGSANTGTIPTPGKTNYYDPAAKKFVLYYQYAGSGGDRVIEEVIQMK